MSAPDVLALLRLHLSEAAQQDCSAAFGISRLRADDTQVFSLRSDAGALMGIAALTRLSETEAEVKSVRTHPDHLRRGVSRRLMDHVEATARTDGVRTLMLETHPTPAYAAAVAMYEKRGYTYRGPFGTHRCSELSIFMELALTC